MGLCYNKSILVARQPQLYCDITVSVSFFWIFVDAPNHDNQIVVEIRISIFIQWICLFRRYLAIWLAYEVAGVAEIGLDGE